MNTYRVIIRPPEGLRFRFNVDASTPGAAIAKACCSNRTQADDDIDVSCRLYALDVRRVQGQPDTRPVPG